MHSMMTIVQTLYCVFEVAKRENLFFNFISLFLDRGEGREKERERNISVWLPLVLPLLGTWPASQACALTGNPTGDPLVRRLALNPLSRTSQGLKEKILKVLIRRKKL